MPSEIISRLGAGEVDTLAGQCTHSGDVDGDASEALFSTAIDGVACLSNCSILVTDPSSRTVRVITPDGSCPGQHDNTWDDAGTDRDVAALLHLPLTRQLINDSNLLRFKPSGRLGKLTEGCQNGVATGNEAVYGSSAW